jgi:hypothetical protein
LSKSIQQSALSIQPKPVHRKGRKGRKGRAIELSINNWRISLFIGLNLTEGFNRRERREREG